jgi:uncharacterized membrane protein
LAKHSPNLVFHAQKHTKHIGVEDGLIVLSEEHTTVLQIVLRVPERRIAWQAISDNFPRGVILFEPLSDRSTQITVRLRSSIEPAKLAKVTRDYLTNFKLFVEQG